MRCVTGRVTVCDAVETRSNEQTTINETQFDEVDACVCLGERHAVDGCVTASAFHVVEMHAHSQHA